MILICFLFLILFWLKMHDSIHLVTCLLCGSSPAAKEILFDMWRLKKIKPFLFKGLSFKAIFLKKSMCKNKKMLWYNNLNTALYWLRSAKKEHKHIFSRQSLFFFPKVWKFEDWSVQMCRQGGWTLTWTVYNISLSLDLKQICLRNIKILQNLHLTNNLICVFFV